MGGGWRERVESDPRGLYILNLSKTRGKVSYSWEGTGGRCGVTPDHGTRGVSTESGGRWCGVSAETVQRHCRCGGCSCR